MYKYSNPEDAGYKKFKLTKDQHNILFKNRKFTWLDEYEYYYNEKQIIMHRFVNWKGVVLSVLSYPAVILFHGLGNFKEINREMKELFNQKKYGSFSVDTVSKNSHTYSDTMWLIERDK